MKQINRLLATTVLGLLSIGCTTEDAYNYPPKVSVVVNIVNGKLNINYAYKDIEEDEEDTDKRVTNVYKVVDGKRVLQFTQKGEKKLDYDLDRKDSPYKIGDYMQIGIIATQRIGRQSTESFSKAVEHTSNPPTVSNVNINYAVFGAESTVNYTYSDRDGNPEDEAAVKVTWYRVRGGTETKLENPKPKLRTYKVSTGFQPGDILKVTVEVKARSGDFRYSTPSSRQLVIDDLSYTIAAKITGTENIGTATVRGTVHNTAASPKKFGEVLNSYLTNDLSTDESNFILEYRHVYKIRIVLGDRRAIRTDSMYDGLRSRIVIDDIPNVETKNLIYITVDKPYLFEVTLTNTGQLTVESAHEGGINAFGAVRGLTVSLP